MTNSRANSRSVSMMPPATPSQPVVIPTRTRQGEQHREMDRDLEIENIPARGGNQHDRQSVPPSVAALLAITSIPGQRHTKRSLPSPPVICSVDVGSPMDGNSSRDALSGQSPGFWGVLLSPPCEAELDDISLMSETTLGLRSSIGSRSTESMPSLEADAHSWGSASSPPSLGIAIVKRNGGERRPKASPSMSEDCGSAHPLLPGPMAPDLNRVLGLGDVEILPVHKTPRGALKATFKSHLTASLRTLKSAAVSFSGLTSPIAQQDDYLARAVLSISLPFTDERRPLSSTSLPDPALRRYLNPVSISPAELYFHHRPSPRNVCTASIQLRTMRKGDRKSAHATAPPVFAAHPLSTPPTDQSTSASTRQREPRENSDFLRVIVLEMNMRRAGKLGHAAPGRARLWLPARQGASPPEVEEGGVPRRWVAQVP